MYTILLAVLLIGEALMLWVGMHIFSNGDNHWTSRKNNIYLIIDGSSGLLLLLGWIFKIPEFIFWVVFIAVVISHSLREYEYLSLQKHPFCSNLPLFMVNNVKLVLSMSTAVIHLTLV